MPVPHDLTVARSRIEKVKHLDTMTFKAKPQLQRIQADVGELNSKFCKLQDEYHSKKKDLHEIEQDMAAALAHKQETRRVSQAATGKSETAQKEMSELKEQEKELSESV